MDVGARCDCACAASAGGSDKCNFFFERVGLALQGGYSACTAAVYASLNFMSRGLVTVKIDNVDGRIEIRRSLESLILRMRGAQQH